MLCSLGQLGVVTSVTIPLVPVPKKIVTFKFFHTQEVDNNCFHSFLKPCKISTITNIIDMELSDELKETRISNGEAKGKIIYFVELGIYGNIIILMLQNLVLFAVI